jgi:integrase
MNSLQEARQRSARAVGAAAKSTRAPGTRSRARHRLTARQVETVGPGLHPDGGGLYLRVREIASGLGRDWLLRYTSPLSGKRKEMGLGSALGEGRASLKRAREKADEARDYVERGFDPLVERERQEIERAEQISKPTPLTFGKFAEEWMDQNLIQHKNAKHRAQWRSTLRKHAETLWNKQLDSISTDDVMGALRPIWTETPETARRTQGRIEKVLDAARAAGHRYGENPARWRGHLELLLAKRPKSQHQPAMSYENIPAFVGELRTRTSVSARALEFLILTAARSGEVRGMTWAELDRDRTTWTVPADRMKTRIEHRVPLTGRAREILSEMERLRTADGPNTLPVFPGHKGGRAKSDNPTLSDMTLTKLLRDMQKSDDDERSSLRQLLKDASGRPVVVHGFRSTFRDWAEDVARFPARVVEHALAHTIKNKAEAAYRRGDAFAQRKELMTAWAAYLDGSGGT